VTRNKVGRMAYYRLEDDHIRRLVLDAAAHASEAVA
jgi:DNA-binding transcriptional ArsR family regulator